MKVFRVIKMYNQLAIILNRGFQLNLCKRHHSFSLTRSLNYSSNFFMRCPLRFLINHFPTSIVPLFFTNSSRFFSSSVASISPVTFLHWGLLISWRMASTRTYSFSKVSLMLSMSEANLSSSIFMNSLMLRSDSLKASSTSRSISYLRALSSLLSTLDILLRNWSIRQLILPTYVLSFNERDYRHWADSTLAAQKEVAQLSRPLQNLLFLSGFEKSNFSSGFFDVARWLLLSRALVLNPLFQCKTGWKSLWGQLF